MPQKAQKARYVDPFQREKKIRRLRAAAQLTVQELSRLSSDGNDDLNSSSISHIEAGGRSITEEAMGKIATAFGLKPATKWERDWTFESFITAKHDDYNDLLNDERDAAPLSPRRSSTDRDRVHDTMVRNKRYCFTRLEDAFDVAMENAKFEDAKRHATSREDFLNRTERAPLPIFEGGVIQTLIFDCHVARLEELVLDCHDGEETMLVLEGEVNYVILSPHPDFGPSWQSRGVPDPRGVLVEHQGLLQLQAQYEKQREAATDREERKLLTDRIGWVKEMLSLKNQEKVEKTVYHRVPCEVFHLAPGDAMKSRSDWPHGAMVAEHWAKNNPGKCARLFFTVSRNYFLDNPTSTNIGEAAK